MGTATDLYQSIEGKYRITRCILSELCRARPPMHLVTWSGLILRELDILTDYAARAEISICISLPTLDAALAHESAGQPPRPSPCLRPGIKLGATLTVRLRVELAEDGSGGDFVQPVLPRLGHQRKLRVASGELKSS